ncbi:hypothetical protein PNA2_1757 [Pyrococcus sp. NA2]|uniref:DUF3216 domain-containing protein n=1 Tax=Pyrococcus sp. (strain NA2) TaxID=342949 RepID=UPI000209AB85|nr:DUF3216 domain-containing protein [Pyrococcus sp. NA2]AEC52672.1 hypothetical protein PNA2_1757 [Pyrococcus sp. NA2]
MPKIKPFEEHTERYDNWFERHKYAYLSELNAIREIMPSRDCVEVGVGTGRFAEPLGIKLGVEPSKKMAEIAEKRGIKVIEGVAENLPFPDNSLDCILMVTTICFVDDPEKAIKEAYRVLKPGGHIIIGFIDRESEIGREYERNKEKSVFYREARFFSTREIIDLLEKSGFKVERIVQTLFHPLNEIKDIEPVEEGFGKGSFVGIRARKKDVNDIVEDVKSLAREVGEEGIIETIDRFIKLNEGLEKTRGEHFVKAGIYGFLEGLLTTLKLKHNNDNIIKLLDTVKRMREQEEYFLRKSNPPISE